MSKVSGGGDSIGEQSRPFPRSKHGLASAGTSIFPSRILGLGISNSFGKPAEIGAKSELEFLSSFLEQANVATFRVPRPAAS
jgi:hypothetical protein